MKNDRKCQQFFFKEKKEKLGGLHMATLDGNN